MKAMGFEPAGTSLRLVSRELTNPIPRAGEVLIRVCAAGVTPTELGWYPTTHTKDGQIRSGAIPVHEFSGVIAGAGRTAPDLPPGTEIFGMNDWFDDGAA